MPDPLNEHGTAGPEDKTTVLPETAVALVEMERLQQDLAASEERAKNHWEQYLRALAEVDNVRKRGAKDLESARQYAVEKFAQAERLEHLKEWSKAADVYQDVVNSFSDRVVPSRTDPKTQNIAQMSGFFETQNDFVITEIFFRSVKTSHFSKHRETRNQYLKSAFLIL